MSVLSDALAAMDKYEEIRMLFIEYITKVQHGMKGRKELAIIDDYERISGRDFIKDRDDFLMASNNKSNRRRWGNE